MPPSLLILLTIVAALTVSALKAWKRTPEGTPRSWLMRMAIFVLCSFLLLVVAILALPGKFRILALAPVFFLSAIGSRVFGGANRRVRQERQEATPDLERMKRLN